MKKKNVKKMHPFNWRNELSKEQQKTIKGGSVIITDIAMI